MSTSSAPRSQSPSIEGLHTVFLTLLPRILLHGEVVFRHTKCTHQKEEFLCEMLALTWKWLLRLRELGKNPLEFPGVLADFAARAVKAGRRLCGKHKGKDVLNPLAQRRHDFVVERLPVSTCRSHESRYSVPLGQQAQDALEERLKDNSITPPPDAVAFKLDFACWLQTLTDRDRSIIGDMILDERTLDLARKFGVSAGRISQLRRQYRQDWRHFCGEEE